MYVLKHKNKEVYFDKNGGYGIKSFTENINRASTYKTVAAANLSLNSKTGYWAFKDTEYKKNQFEPREAKIILI